MNTLKNETNSDATSGRMQRLDGHTDWVKVEDGLPTMNYPVLTCDMNYPEDGQEIEEMVGVNVWQKSYSVSHWRCLHSLPNAKGDSQENAKKKDRGVTKRAIPLAAVGMFYSFSG